MKRKLLILEDDIVLRETLEAELQNDYAVDTAKHGEEVLALTFDHHYDLYLFDINVPYIDGLTLLHDLRSVGDDTPTLLLTSKNTESDRIKGFNVGCDDYLGKPFSLRELKLRIHAIIKRTHGLQITSYDDIYLDLENNYITINNKPITLHKKRLEILHLFINHPNVIFSYDDIIKRIYTDNDVSDTVIRVHISKINELFGNEKRIRNIRGKGYKYDKI